VSPKLTEGKTRDKIKAEKNEMENRKIIEKKFQTDEKVNNIDKTSKIQKKMKIQIKSTMKEKTFQVIQEIKYQRKFSTVKTYIQKGENILQTYI
jgi:hypothetical protein